MIRRKEIEKNIRVALKRSRVVELIGPRQSGKTTLARSLVKPGSPNYFDLEDPTSRERLNEPMTELKSLRGLVVIDEVQRKPEVFPVLRVLADRRPLPARFLLLGSASPVMMRHSSETLTGRAETILIGGFSISEIGFENQSRLWLRGGLPPSYLARSEADSHVWRSQYVSYLLERDLPQMGVNIPAPALLRFWTMVAHYHGQIWSSAEPARSLGISEPTARRYLDLLEGMFMVRQLYPWHENLGKRQVKSPKVYFRDTGILHYLMNIRTVVDLARHPKYGASWEGFVIEETLKRFRPREAYFWATHNGAELDLLFLHKGKRMGVECKRADAPKHTASMKIAMRDLKLDRLAVVYPGEQSYSLDRKTRVIPLKKWLLDPESSLWS